MAGPYFWVGGSGNASDATNHWATSSGGAPNVANVPTSTDDVSFDSASNATAYTVTVDATFSCANMTWALPGTSGVPTLANSGASSINLSGNLTLIAGMVSTFANSIIVTGALASRTITTAGVTLSNNFTQTATGTVTLADAQTMNSARGWTVTAGTLVTGAFTHSWGSFASISGVRTLTLTNSTINITGTSGTPWNVSTAGTLTFTATGSTINVNGGAAGIGLSLTLANVTYGAFNITGAGSWTITNAIASFTTFSYASTTNKTDALALGSSSFTIAAGGTLSVAGNSTINRAFVRSSILGTQRSISVPTGATVSLTNVDFQDVASAGTFGTWTGTSLGDALGNSGITFDTSAQQTYAGGGGNWDNSALWTSRTPLPQDDVVLPATTAGTLVATMPRLGRNITMTNFDRALAFTSASNSIFGNITLGASSTLSGTNAITLTGRGSQTLTSNGKSFPQSVTVAAFGGTYTLQDAFACVGGALVVNNGVFADGGNTVTAPSLQSVGSAVRSLNCSGTWSLINTSGTIWNAASTLTVTAAPTIKLTGTITAASFSGGGLTYGTLWWSSPAGSGVLTLLGANTFGDLKINRTTARTITWPASTTNVIGSWTDENLGTAVLTVNSNVSGTAATLSKASGVVSTDYLSLKDNTATGGASWYAGDNSSIVSNVTGWILAAAPTTNAPGPMLIGGPGLTELFVTGGQISAMSLSYLINPLSRRTV